MSGIRARGEDIRRFILQNVQKHPSDISRQAADHFGITRQAVNKHLQRLADEGALTVSGQTRARSYAIAPVGPPWQKLYKIADNLDESSVWLNDIKPCLGNLADNVMNIWHIGFTEMFNNAIEHSDGRTIWVQITKTARNCEMIIVDDGVGIFAKIQDALNLADPRHAVLELAKGKFTTDPKHHSGQGIFFTSKMLEQFDIISQGVAYSHDAAKDQDWVMESASSVGHKGTGVFLGLDNHTARTALRIYNDYSTVEAPGFSKTVIPVGLAQYGDDQLISRSQAKRLLARVELFKTVLLDFKGVTAIGQAFADEIFRVFASQHTEIELIPLGTNPEVAQMIARTRGDEKAGLGFAQLGLPGVEG